MPWSDGEHQGGPRANSLLRSCPRSPTATTFLTNESPPPPIPKPWPLTESMYMGERERRAEAKLPTLLWWIYQLVQSRGIFDFYGPPTRARCQLWWPANHGTPRADLVQITTWHLSMVLQDRKVAGCLTFHLPFHSSAHCLWSTFGIHPPYLNICPLVKAKGQAVRTGHVYEQQVQSGCLAHNTI